LPHDGFFPKVERDFTIVPLIPPGFKTRNSSLANWALSGICGPASIDQTTSKLASGKDSASASSTLNWAFTSGGVSS
jgi:hypothetical protein